MRKLLFCLLFLTAANVVKAQYPGYNKLADMGSFKKNFTAASQQINSISSDFVQEKELSMLAEKITAKGKFWFKKPNQVRMEYTNPFQYLMIINKDKIFIKDGARETSVSSRSNKMFQQVNKILIDCMQGTTLDNRDFTTRVFESKSNYLVELVPVAKGLRELFKNINLVVDKKDYGATSISMYEPLGDYTIIRFTNRIHNSNLADALFSNK